MRVSDGASGRFLMQAARPNFYNLSFDVNGFETEYGYNGKSGWTRNSPDGLRTLIGEESLDVQAEAAYRGSLWLNAKQDKSRIVSAGQSQVSGRQVNVVVINSVKGSFVKLYFDAIAGGLLREEMGMGNKRSFEYSEFRSIDGRPQPGILSMTIDGEAYRVELDNTKTNSQIARGEFDFSAIVGEPLPDIPALLLELEANEEKIEKLLDTYSFK
ncbi:MAG: hypothetical protein LC730_05450 [Acidobacteria bacterium]|nr:hypothetical protein [Acidobacteriota bacterium]MCA1608888.1 hypothetical protein [Acidobacteriota bacterium]